MAGKGELGRNLVFTIIPSEMMVYPGQLKSKSRTTHPYRSCYEIHQDEIITKSQSHAVEQKHAMAEIRGYANPQNLRLSRSPLLFFLLLRANSG